MVHLVCLGRLAPVGIEEAQVVIVASEIGFHLTCVVGFELIEFFYDYLDRRHKVP